MNCPRCGAENEEGRAACWKCYAPLTGVAREAHEKQALQPQFIPAPKIKERPARARPSPLPKILTLVIILAIAGGAGWWSFLYVPNTPKGVVLGFLKAGQKAVDSGKLGSTDRSRFLTKESAAMIKQSEEDFKRSSREAQQALKELAEAFKALRPARPAKPRKVEYKVMSVSQEGGKATVKVRSEVKDRKVRQDLPLPRALTGMSYVTLKEDGKWKVDLIATIDEMTGAASGELMKQAPQWPSTPGTAPGWGAPPAPMPSR